MKPIIDRLKVVGANDTTINIFLVLFMMFFFVMAVGMLVIMGYDLIIKNVQPAPWLASAFGGIIAIIGTIFAVQHTTVALNTTQANTVREQQLTTKPIIDASASSTVLLAQTLQQVLASMSDVNKVQAQSVADVKNATPITESAGIAESSDTLREATKHNTEVTIENTAAVKDMIQEKPTNITDYMRG